MRSGLQLTEPTLCGCLDGDGGCGVPRGEVPGSGGSGGS